MKRIKNRKTVKNVKNVNNAVKNNDEVDMLYKLIDTKNEFYKALEDEVANREYERKKRAKKLEKTASNDAKEKKIKEIMESFEKATGPIEIKINSGAMHLSSEPRGRAMKRNDCNGFYFTDGKIRPAFVVEELKEERKKNKPASDVESLKAELEKYKILMKGYRLELSKLQEADMRLAAHFEGVCAERDNFAACLEACEKDLKQKQEEAIIMRQEAVFQYKRAEKAERFIKQIDGACDLIKKHIAAYGSKKKSK